jgi:putative phage-type endonuclease
MGGPSYLVIECATEAEWLEQRRQGIGASEAAAILGASPWQSALSVWARKLGLDDESVDSEAMEWGSELEPLIANKYERVTGRELMNLGRYAVLYDPARPWLRCTLDRVIKPVAGHEGPGVLEIKTAGAQFGRDWEDNGVPMHYQIQVQHQLAVTGLKWGAVAVLIGGQKFRQTDIERDDALIAEIVSAEDRFWNEHVLAAVAPPPDGTEQTKALLARLFPEPKAGVAPVPLPAEAVNWDAEFVEAKAQISTWEVRKTESENRIKAAIGDAPSGLLPGGVVYAWTPQNRNAFQVAESTTRILRRKEPKA